MRRRFTFSRLLAPLAGLLILVGAIIWGYVGVKTDEANFVSFMDEYYSNASTELFSIGVTVLVIDGLNRLRARADEKRRLILQMGSDDNTLAKEAARILELEGWGFRDDKTLQKARLGGANLQEAFLWDANLQQALLGAANLQGADLRGANLQGARLGRSELLRTRANLVGTVLMYANLQEADLEEANLRGADMRGANLQDAYLANAVLLEVKLERANLEEANLFGANLQGADLREANLQGANLDRANLNRTWLPDHTRWTLDTDMARFTDPEHPDFWRSDSPDSPAYRGNDDDNGDKNDND